MLTMSENASESATFRVAIKVMKIRTYFRQNNIDQEISEQVGAYSIKGDSGTI